MRCSIKTLLVITLLVPLLNTSCRKDFSDIYNWFHDNDHKQKDNLSNQLVLDWSLTAFEAGGGAAEPHPLLATRSKTMMHIAIHDALNAITPMYEQYAYQGADATADPFAATSSSAHTVLKALWPDSAAMLDKKLSASLSSIAEGEAKTKGIALGKAAANAILDLRSNDGAYQNPVGEVFVSTKPGVYNAVPPVDFQYAPFWKTMMPFSMESYDQFRPAPPPALTSFTYTQDFNEVKEVGKKGSTTRTADQSAYAKFWYELTDIGWNRIARIMVTEKKPGLYKTARMFALLNMALADGYTAGWDSKQYYFFWRPYTAIHAAKTDGNDKTAADKNWESAEPTPPVPEYLGTHSANGNAAAIVLSYFFGDHTSFTTTSTTAGTGGEERSFESFHEAAVENADSRVMAGIHFRFSCNAGLKQGEEIGKWTLQNHLKPLH